jgi:hypothetical protein
VCRQSAFPLAAPPRDCPQSSQPLCANLAQQRFRLSLEAVIGIEPPGDPARGTYWKTRDILRDASR